ncbi:ABC transporter ATP-binding protein [Bifidobacterium mongoliense]|uniref:ABC transporter ATP-binding protein n=1 Tax=Bifidobacterium mongoliense TaxID=518643 RepID=UPI002648CF28|nr:ABC transporter ATP-binding protein [Bifidobacterium mongoliense]MDN6025016.1 ABC transporter ATP-binding protein [Bifidobacterium mongoliense]
MDEHVSDDVGAAPVVVRVSGLCQGYGGTTVLRNINIDVHGGEILALIGPSGSGKTTLISTIMGMLRARSGSVHVLGVPMPDREQLGKIGFMAQADALYTRLTGLENLRFFAALDGIERCQRTAVARSVAHVVNLEPVLGRRVAHYSGGMRRRLSLAIALIGDAPLLILDEPTVGIDPELRRQICQELHRIADRGRTIVLTTHVMADAAQANRVLMIRRGEVIADGSVEALKRRYRSTDIEDAFIRAGREQDARHSDDE